MHIYFRRPREEALRHVKQNEVYVTFYSPRQGAPSKSSRPLITSVLLPANEAFINT